MDIPPMEWRFPPEEQKLIDEFRDRVKDVDACAYWKENIQLRRFLAARENDLEKAEKMYRAAMKWRKAMRADYMLREYKEPEALKLYFPHGFIGHDKEGHPLLIERAGNIDLPGLRDAVGEEELLRWIAYYHERQELKMREACLKENKLVHMMTVIVDMKGMGMKHMGRATTSLIKKRTRLEEDNYPEVCKRVLLIRAPGIMATMWKLVKVFIDKGTREKIRILGKKFMPTVEEYVDRSNIPGYLGGGLKPNGDPECKTLMVHGGVVPLKYRLGLSSEASTLSINSGYCYDHQQQLPKGGSISWVFRVDGGRNIGFSLHFKPGPVKVDTVPVEATAEAGPQEGETKEEEKQDDTGAATPEPSSAAEEETPTSPQTKYVNKAIAPTVVCDKTTTFVGDVVEGPERMTEGTGDFTAPEDGTVTLRFDNTFSWMKGKTVIAEINAEVPQEEIPEELEDNENKKKKKKVVIRKKRSKKSGKDAAKEDSEEAEEVEEEEEH